jgi:hypothetical protein
VYHFDGPRSAIEGREEVTAICRRTDLSKNYAASASFLAPEPQTFEVPQSGGSVVLRTALGCATTPFSLTSTVRFCGWIWG